MSAEKHISDAGKEGQGLHWQDQTRQELSLVRRCRFISGAPLACHHGTHPPTWAAFPQRSPNDIRLMYADHRLAYPSDNGIRFEPAEDTPATVARLG
jgi:hypothetical protein